jgi:parallel beta-helix repeat protein
MKKFNHLLTVAFAGFISANTMAADIIVKSGTLIQDGVRKAESGDRILVEPGLYHESVYIDKSNITLKGMQKDGRFAVLDGKNKLNDGIITSGHFSVIDGFKVRGYKGNAIMTQGANNFEIINNLVDGAFYGIFPQYGKNGLVKGNTVVGAEDAGIYVGMSDNIDVLENIAYENVMGLEFENCRDALMADNKVYNNSTGIALTLIPGLPVKDAYNIIIRDNEITDNNHVNFAPSSSIAAGIPQGIGVLVVGADKVTIENNVIEDNNAAGVAVFDMLSFGLARDSQVDPFTDQVRIMANQWKNNGNNPVSIMGELLGAAGKGFEVVATGKEKDSCILPQGDVNAIGTRRWGECSEDMSQATYKTAMLDKPVEAIEYTAEQKGRLTYLAVCTGCHAYDSVLHGPSVKSIQALYNGKPEALAAYASEPVQKRAGFPEMPPQEYLGEQTLSAIADYILTDL